MARRHLGELLGDKVYVKRDRENEGKVKESFRLKEALEKGLSHVLLPQPNAARTKGASPPHGGCL